MRRRRKDSYGVRILTNCLGADPGLSTKLEPLGRWQQSRHCQGCLSCFWPCLLVFVRPGRMRLRPMVSSKPNAAHRKTCARPAGCCLFVLRMGVVLTCLQECPTKLPYHGLAEGTTTATTTTTTTSTSSSGSGASTSLAKCHHTSLSSNCCPCCLCLYVCSSSVCSYY